MQEFFEFYREDIKELFVYDTVCPKCKRQAILYVNTKCGTNECSSCQTIYELTEKEYVKTIYRK